ncbi:MAG TPA: patatin-like phospholipase family protein [Thermoanaerobaculia bacterium]|jgi:NTE family protein|nr:patatin-like phospholipase family protein [Thermoanaerobaculia bacterium]
MNRTYRLLAAALAVVCFACSAHYPINPELKQAPNLEYGYRWATTDIPDSDKSTFVILTFSGGGTRAAGFSYGVLKKLDTIDTNDGKKLLDHVNVISSVSGGSFTSMYYGLHGRGGFKTFESDFLRQDIQGQLFHSAFLSPNVFKLLFSPNFHRIDVASELYDAVLFKDKKFKDLLDEQPKWHAPLIIANSTEIELGARFEWTQDQFDPICSDINQVHVARAVAASSAFPGLLSPMVLDTYRSCGYIKPPTWAGLARADVYANPSRPRLADELDGYMNPARTHLHMLDGGLADNIGLRAPMHAIISSDTFAEPTRHPPHTGFTINSFLLNHEIRRILVIVVNSGTSSSKVVIDATAAEPGIKGVIGAVTGTPMDNVSFDSVESLLATFRSRAADQQAAGDANRTVYYPVILSFSLIKDDKLRATVNGIGTNFSNLSDESFNGLMEASQVLIDQDPCFKQFMIDTGATPVSTVATGKCVALTP